MGFWWTVEEVSCKRPIGISEEVEMWSVMLLYPCSHFKGGFFFFSLFSNTNIPVGCLVDHESLNSFISFGSRFVCQLSKLVLSK